MRGRKTCVDCLVLKSTLEDVRAERDMIREERDALLRVRDEAVAHVHHLEAKRDALEGQVAYVTDSITIKDIDGFVYCPFCNSEWVETRAELIHATDCRFANKRWLQAVLA